MNYSTLFGSNITMSRLAAPTAAGGSWWDTITGGITKISNVATQVYGVKTQLQNLKNAQAAQQHLMPYIAPNTPVQYAPNTPVQYAPNTPVQYAQNTPVQYAPSTAAAPANHTMLYIGGAVVVALVGFLMMRKK